MSDLDDEAIVVTLPADGDDAVVTKVEGGETTTPTEDPLEALKDQFTKATQRATAAELAQQNTARQLEETTRELQTTKTAVTDSQLDTVTTGIKAAEAAAEAAEKELIAAYEAGDAAAQARAQRKISAAEVRIQRLTEAKGDLEEAKSSKPSSRTETRSESRPQLTDRVEQFASQMSPRSAAWIRAHPDCITDDRKNARMIAAHKLCEADGIPIDSDEYFSRIEAGIGAKPAVVEKKSDPKPAEPSGKRPISVAASGANTGGGMNGGSIDIALTPREVAAAEDGTHVWHRDDPKGKFKKGDPIGRQEFARRKMIMKKEGRYDRTYTES